MCYTFFVKERKHIRLLPAAVANKIAAGEVVERPASVVKEFMENAFDAGASRIEVTVVSGGRKLISVADDGCGMERDDALMCLEPQATSKIRDVDDIEKISTYGFRGEAVPSVAAVSRLILKTCAEGESTGTKIEVDGGKVRDVSDIGFPAGTTFEVRDLFFNVPARRKFLRTYATEQAHVRSVFCIQALAHPEATLKLKADGRDLVSVAGGASLAERVHDLFGASFLDALRPVDFTSGEVHVSGFVGLPTLTRADRGEQYIFVNRRAATAPIIPFALREAYPPLDGDRKPIAILFIELPPTEVDVNVHPTKREVRFRDSRGVRDAVILAVQKALGVGSFAQGAAPGHGDAAPALPGVPLSPSSVGLPPSGASPAAPAVPPAAPAASALPAPSVAPALLPTPLPPPAAQPTFSAAYGGRAAGRVWPPSATGRPVAVPVPSARRPDEPPPASPAVGEEAPPPGAAAENGLWQWCRLLGRIGGGYVLLETDGGYVVMDPRAVHERIVYERMLDGAAARNPPAQSLLLPETLTLPAEDAERIASNLDLLRQIGFAIDPFGDDTFIVEAVPSGVGLSSIRPLLTDISKGIADAGAKRGVEDWRLRAVAQAAAESAVSRMEALPYKALAALVEDIAKTRMPYTSPKGRPTMFFTSTRELDRKFGISR